MVTGLMDGSVIAWEARNPSARPRDVLKLDAHDGAVSALSFPTKVIRGLDLVFKWINSNDEWVPVLVAYVRSL